MSQKHFQRLCEPAFGVPQATEGIATLQHSGPSITARSVCFTARCRCFTARRNPPSLCMHRSAPSDPHRNRRNRSRSIRAFDRRLPAEERRGIELSQRFRRVQQENRSGVQHRRRYKAACLDLLEHLQFLVALVISLTYPNTSRVLLQRAGQIQSRINDCRANRVPGRTEPLLERIEGESDQSGTDSEAAGCHHI